MSFQVEELTVEVRDADLKLVGQVPPENLVDALFINRFNNTGTWQLSFPYGDPLGDLLRTPGYGIRVTMSPDDETLISGPTLSAKLTQTPEDLAGRWVIEGSSDDIVLQERLAYPDPTEDDVTAQTVSHDRRTGEAETVMKGYVEDNMGPTAPAVRQVPGLVVATDNELGPVVDTAARFTKIQELLYGVAESSGLGYLVQQVDDELIFEVYEPVDRSSTIRMDIENNQISSVNYGYSAPGKTRAVVAGQGEAVERLFLESTNAESLAAETLWSRRIEVFQDARQAESIDELTQAGEESLSEDGKTVVSLEVAPSDDIQMRYGRDWFLGDVVTVVSGLIETTATVTEVGISVKPDGVRVAVLVGDPELKDFDSRLVSKVNKNEERISSLERNTTGYGITTEYQPDGGTDGTQPTFSGPAIFGTYVRFGNMVHFSIQVDFDNITSFGTGQYYLTLPYPAREAYQFRDGCLHDISAGFDYTISGHVNALSDVLTLNTTGISVQRVYDDPFTSTAPVTLDVADNFHIAGTYEIEV
jgi:hypothetical protein